MMNAILVLLLATAQDRPVPDVGFEPAFEKLKFDRCVGIAHPPDGTNRIFIIEQKGRVKWFDNKPDAAEATVALDLTDKVLSSGNEEGLLGLAFHPNFKTNHQIFLQYSYPQLGPNRKRDPDTRTVTARFVMDKSHVKIVPESEKVILEIKQPYENHNGGVLQFGPDGYLYIGKGDGGSANDPHGNGQNMATMLGKFLRIDVDHPSDGKAYGVPKDNPFVGKEGVLPEIWCFGVRNPWGYHFDRKTGELWSSDVGQDKWEEVNIIKKGLNYGWSVREGLHPFGGKGEGPFEDPIVEHGHDVAKSVTGGCVYRGKRLKELDGIYLYGDFVTGNMWGLRWDGKKLLQNKLLFEFRLKQIATFGEDRDGDVLWSTFTDGRLYRFAPAR
jgi:glucose/arabinose dehydrogenase